MSQFPQAAATVCGPLSLYSEAQEVKITRDRPCRGRLAGSREGGVGPSIHQTPLSAKPRSPLQHPLPPAAPRQGSDVQGEPAQGQRLRN